MKLSDSVFYCHGYLSLLGLNYNAFCTYNCVGLYKILYNVHHAKDVKYHVIYGYLDYVCCHDFRCLLSVGLTILIDIQR